MLGISQQQACDWRREGIGPEWIRLPGGKAIRYDRASIEQFIADNTRTPMTSYSPIPQQRILEAADVSAHPEHASVIAEEGKLYIPCLMSGDHVGMAKVVNASRYPVKMHFAAMAGEADDPDQFLDVLAEIIARD